MRHPTTRLPWHIPLIFAITFIVHYLDRNIIAFALPRMAQDLQWDDRQVGEYGQYLLGAFFLTYGIAQLLLSGPAERFGANNGRIARIILLSTAAAFLSFSATVALLVGPH